MIVVPLHPYLQAGSGMDLPEHPRFWSKVDIRGDNECWPWTAYRNPSGYGYRG